MDATPAQLANGTPRGERWAALGVMAGLALLVTIIYFPTLAYPFVDFDDHAMIYENPYVTAPLSAGSVKDLVLKSQHYGVPLAFLHFHIQYQFFGEHAGGYHAASAVWHLANAILVFLLLRSMLGGLWRPALAAALFAVHPQRVESVAWACEQRDVMFTLFGLIAVVFHLRHARRPSAWAQVGCLFAFALSILSKQMLLTFPFLLLLLDAWPLRRWLDWGTQAPALPDPASGPVAPRAVWRLALEKAPMALGLAIYLPLNYLIFTAFPAFHEQFGVPLGTRFLWALHNYWHYTAKAFWPSGLCVFYEQPDSPPMGPVIAGALLLIGGSALALWQRRRRPWLALGWFWYIGTMAPASGLMLHNQPADRYTYFPQIGLILALVWGVAELGERLGERVAGVGALTRKRVGMAIAGGLVLGLTGLAMVQVRTWRDSEALWGRTIQVNPRVVRGHEALARAILPTRPAQAAHHLERALALYKEPAPQTRANLAILLVRLGRQAQAVAHFEQAARELDQEAAKAGPEALKPINESRAALLAGWGEALLQLERPGDAEGVLARAAERSPTDAGLWRNLGLALSRQGKLEPAIAAYGKSLALDDKRPDTHNNLGIAYAKAQRLPEAEASFRRALAIDPGYADALANLARVLSVREKP